MHSHEITTDVGDLPGLTGPLTTAATVHVPDRIDGSTTVMFAFAGGGFGRRYYDVQAKPGYSQAEHHTSDGFVFVACDHLCTGDSTTGDPLAYTYENLAEANHRTTTAILERLRSGTLASDLDAVAVERVVGMGQSMGGCLLTVQQANHATFDGVALLGWSGIYTNFPSPDGGRVTYPMPPRGADLRPIAEQVLGKVAPEEDEYRFCFHWPDEDPDLLERDLASYRPFTGLVRGDEATPWGSSDVPACAVTMMTEGSVAAEAAAITVPVLAASGERDVVPDPWAEPSAYRGSWDVSVFVVPRMAHMHNFARTRAQLWERIAAFARSIGGRRRE